MLSAIRDRVIEVTTKYQGSSYRGYYKISGIVLSTIRDRVIEVTYNYQGSIYRGYCELSGIELTVFTVSISHIYELINLSTAHLQPPNNFCHRIRYFNKCHWFTHYLAWWTWFIYRYNVVVFCRSYGLGVKRGEGVKGSTMNTRILQNFPIFGSLFLNLYGLKDSFFWFDTWDLAYSIVYIERLQVQFSKQNCISFSDDSFCVSKQCRLWWCGILSGSSLFAKDVFRRH